jgi:hypothetical protein
VNCFTCQRPIAGTRRRKYCSESCWPSHRATKAARPSSCLVCAKPITQPRAAGNPRKTCSRKCRDAKRIALRPKKPQTNKSCTICGLQFATSLDHQKTCSKPCSKERSRRHSEAKWLQKIESRPAYKLMTCAWCEEDLLWPSDKKGYAKYHAECKKPARQSQYRIKSIRRQTKLAGKRISHQEIAERDYYKCHLCGGTVDMGLPRTHRYGATLDHLTPLSLGGEDTPDNVKLAHWICNIRRSNKPLEESDA